MKSSPTSTWANTSISTSNISNNPNGLTSTLNLLIEYSKPQKNHLPISPLTNTRDKCLDLMI